MRKLLVRYVGPGLYEVVESGSSEVVARIQHLPDWQKHKIVGEDVYGKTVAELVERLEQRPLTS